MLPKPLFNYLQGETSVSDLKTLSELLMSGSKLTKYNLAMIRAKNYTLIGGKHVTFYNNEGIALILEKILRGELPAEKVLTDIAITLQAIDDDVYFDKNELLGKIKNHLRSKKSHRS